MRRILIAVTAALAGCATPQTVVTEVKTVEIKVPVRVSCLNVADIPAKPEKIMKADADVRGLAAGAVAQLREWEVYYAKTDALLRGCL